MADEADIAQAIAAAATDRAIKAQVGGPRLVGTATCLDCDDAIPAARRAANPAALRCIDCQEAYEAGARHMKRGA